MTYLQFREQWHRVGCFNIYQVRAVCPRFDRGNLGHWVKKGYLIRLRQDWYAFADLLQVPEFSRYIAQKIYAPSYISLHSALSYYGIIPEAVIRITCVSTNRTTCYENDFGEYSYQTVKPELFFGYEPMILPQGYTYHLALPEKALLDLLYLYPQYNTENEMLELRLDDYWMQEELNVSRLREFAGRVSSKSLQKRTELLLQTYRYD
jgi:predicted transcriptional regulator of viral defense system